MAVFKRHSTMLTGDEELFPGPDEPAARKAVLPLDESCGQAGWLLLDPSRRGSKDGLGVVVPVAL